MLHILTNLIPLRVSDEVNNENKTRPLSTSAAAAMALFRRPGVAQAFHDNRQLQQFVLTGVTPTGRVLGTGSYGSVEEVSVELLGP